MDLTGVRGASATGRRSRKSREIVRMPVEPVPAARNDIFIVSFHRFMALIESPDSRFRRIHPRWLRSFAGPLLLLRHNKDQTQ
jgi:hypothetical protein